MEDAPEVDKRTIVIKGISYAWQKADLETAFSDIGPIRKCFLVGDKGAAHHKGTGFVQFALPEDADKAVEQINGQKLGGRKLQVSHALRRAPLEQRKKRKHPEEATEPSQSGPAGPKPKPGTPTPGPNPAEKQPQANPTPSAAQRPPKTLATVNPTPSAVHRLPKKLAAGNPTLWAVQQPPKTLAAAFRERVGRDRTQGVGISGGKTLAEKPAGKPAAQGIKHRNVRTVALGGVLEEAMGKALELAAAAGKVEEVVSSVPPEVVQRFNLAKDGCTGALALVVYESVKTAMQAVSKLHGKAIDAAGSEEPPKKKKKGKTEAQAASGDRTRATSVLWARQLGGEGALTKRWRLIVRNLPFNVKEEQLRSLFEPAGFVWELTLPRKPDGRIQGFGFVGFTCRAHAEAGIRLVNLAVLGGRTLAVDWAVPKAKFRSALEGEVDKEGEESDAEDSELSSQDGRQGREEVANEEDGSGDDAEPDVEKEKEVMKSVLRQFDVGNTEPKTSNKSQPGKPQSAAGGTGLPSDAEMSDEDDDVDSMDDEVSDEDDDADDVSEDADMECEEDSDGDTRDSVENTEDNGEGESDGASDGEDVKPNQATGHLGGPDPAAAGQGRVQQAAEGQRAPFRRSEVLGGTVFVRGLPLDVSKAKVQARLETYGRVRDCRLVVDKATQKLKGTAFVEYFDAADAERAAGVATKARTGQGPAIHIGGKPVEVHVALSQEGAVRLASAKGDQGGKDGRNLYLCKEGRIEEGSPAWAAMSEADQQRRKRAAGEMSTKLRSPNFFVSRTRLCVRNIPYALDEKALKQLIVDAVKDRAQRAQPRVKQVKILRNEDKKGGDGVAASRGMAFVELDDHEHALCALRSLNNNPAPFGKDRRPLVEFAVENVRAVKTREAKQATAKQAGKAPAAPGAKLPEQAMPNQPKGMTQALPGHRTKDLPYKGSRENDGAGEGDGPPPESRAGKRKRVKLEKQAEEPMAGAAAPAGAPPGEQRMSKAAAKRHRKKRALAKSGARGPPADGEPQYRKPPGKFPRASAPQPANDANNRGNTNKNSLPNPAERRRPEPAKDINNQGNANKNPRPNPAEQQWPEGVSKGAKTRDSRADSAPPVKGGKGGVRESSEVGGGIEPQSGRGEFGSAKGRKLGKRGDVGGSKGAKGGKGGDDKLDLLVQQYQAKLFGAGAADGRAKQSRWFA